MWCSRRLGRRHNLVVNIETLGVWLQNNLAQMDPALMQNPQPFLGATNNIRIQCHVQLAAMAKCTKSEHVSININERQNMASQLYNTTLACNSSQQLATLTPSCMPDNIWPSIEQLGGPESVGNLGWINAIVCKSTHNVNVDQLDMHVELHHVCGKKLVVGCTPLPVLERDTCLQQKCIAFTRMHKFHWLGYKNRKPAPNTG